jgi:hypothetical protein
MDTKDIKNYKKILIINLKILYFCEKAKFTT